MGKLLAKFVVDGNPVSKKNGRPIFQRGGRPFLGKSHSLKAVETEWLASLYQQRAGVRCPIDQPVHIRFTFYRQDARKIDLSNLYELPQDMLQAAGILANDQLIESHDGSRKHIDRQRPRTEIEIYTFDETT